MDDKESLPRGTFMPHKPEEIVKENKQPEINQDGLHSIRTFEVDTAETIKTQNVSMASIALAEQARKFAQAQEEVEAKTSNRKIILVGISLILIVMALGGIFVAFYSTKQKPPEIPVQTVRDSVIKTDQQVTIEINPNANRNTFVTHIKNQFDIVEQNGVTEFLVNFNGKQASIEELLPLISPSASSPFIRNLSPEYMLGAYREEGSKTGMFMLLKYKDYNQAFAGMLGWEPEMTGEVADLFLDQTEQIPSNGLMSPFTDAYINNKDVRIVKKNGSTYFLYSLIDQNTILITTSEAAMRELTRRLTETKLVR